MTRTCVCDGVELPGLAGLAGSQSPVGPEEQTLEAVYFDTDDLRRTGRVYARARRPARRHGAGRGARQRRLLT
jgi:hypothetical protein